MSVFSGPPSGLQVSPPDLFLLERWDRASPLSPDEQCEALCTEYVSRGRELHYHYFLLLLKRLQLPRIASSLPEDDQILLASIPRSLIERNAGDFIWLRTCYFDKYGNSTDQAHEKLFEESGLQDMPELLDSFGHEYSLLFDDVERYNYGSKWQKIFSRIPQLVDDGVSPEICEKMKSDALEIAYDIADAESYGQDPEAYSQSEDGTDWTDLYSGVHWRSTTGVIWVADEEALQTGKVLIAWFDDCGRIVRSSRMRASSVGESVGLLRFGDGGALSHWQNGWIGDDYDVGGIFGPPESKQ